MAKKTFNQKLQESKDLPKIAEIINPKAISIFGGTRLLIAPPLAYDEIMKQVPEGKLITSDSIRSYLAISGIVFLNCKNRLSKIPVPGQSRAF